MFGVPVFGWLIAVVVAAGLAVFQYYLLLQRDGKWLKSPWLWAMISRFLAWMCLILLLFNPWWIHVKQWVQDPILLVYTDASKSVSAADKSKWAGQLTKLNALKGVSLQTYSAADAVVLSKQSNALNTYHTNLSSVIRHANDIASNTAVAGIVWMTDGIGNEGVNPKFEMPVSGVPWFTVGVGDPSPQIDASVALLQCNEEAFIGNVFTVEASVKSQRLKSKPLRIQLKAGGQTYEQLWTPGSEQDWRRFSFEIRPTRKGLIPIEMVVRSNQSDQNPANNRLTRYVKVVDERKKVAILYGSPHPDVSALKSALEAGGQFIVSSTPRANANPEVDVYVLHGCKFQSARELDQLKSWVSAGKAIWIFATELQNNLALTKIVGLSDEAAWPRNWQEIQPHWNNGEANWGMDGVEASRWVEFPPVYAPVYKPSAPAAAEVMLYQRWSGVNTQIPLMIQWAQGDASVAMFYGEGVWRWRIAEKSKHGDAKAFDAWVRRSVGLLVSSASARKPIEILLAGTSFDARDQIVAKVVCRDRSGMMDHAQDRRLELSDARGKKRTINLVKGNQGWVANLSGLAPGAYQLTAQTVDGKSVVERTFVVVDQPAETMNLQADHGLLQQLATQSGGQFLSLGMGDSIGTAIAQKMIAKPVMKAQSTNVHWWDSWPWMILIAVFFGIEWWIRRYLGKY